MIESNTLLMSGTPTLAPRCVALTFDDGPGPRSAELVQLLHAEGVPATFFVLGESIERYGEVLDSYRGYGHTIALHSEYHRPFSSPELALDQLRRCQDRVAHLLDDTVWFRPPYGIGDRPVPGYTGPVGWHAHGRDWDITYRQGQSVEACVQEIVQTLQRLDGGIPLLHDFAPYTEFTAGGLTEADLDLRVLDIAELLIKRLRELDFTFVTLPEPDRQPVAG